MVDETNITQDEESTATAQSVVDHAKDVAANPPADATGGGLSLLKGVGLKVTVELGRTRMKIADILALSAGSVVELQKLASEPVDILVNDTLFARGEVVVVDDHFAVKLTELVETPGGVTES